MRAPILMPSVPAAGPGRQCLAGPQAAAADRLRSLRNILHNISRKIVRNIVRNIVRTPAAHPPHDLRTHAATMTNTKSNTPAAAPTPDMLNARGEGHLPGHLGIAITRVEGKQVEAEMPVQAHLMAPNGYLHAGAVVTLADTCCGYGCVANLPASASGFTTIELKSNHLGTTRDGTVVCVATAVHLGGSTQVWDAVVSHRESGKTLALFRCTQMVLRKPA